MEVVGKSPGRTERGQKVTENLSVVWKFFGSRRKVKLSHGKLTEGLSAKRKGMEFDGSSPGGTES